MRATLVRIGIDRAYGAWNAPVDLETYDFVYVPNRSFRRIGLPCPAVIDALRQALPTLTKRLERSALARPHFDPAALPDSAPHLRARP